MTTEVIGTEVIRTENLTKRYGDRNVVDHLDLSVPQGVVYGFMGLNGAGKSTTMKMLLGLTTPTEGRIEVFGQPLDKNLSSILARTGSLIEGPSYYPNLTGAENLAILQRLLNLPSRRVDETLEVVGLAGARNKLAKSYSLGMKQRLGIAMALLANPQLLILDEPTNGLDPAGIHEIRELLVTLAHRDGVTVLVSTHLLAEIDLMADQVGIIHEGILRYQGPLEGLRDNGHLVLRTSDNRRIRESLRQWGCPVADAPSDNPVEVPGEVTDLNRAHIVRYVLSEGADVYEISHKRRSLEDVFLDLTEGLSSIPERAAA